MDDLDRLFRRVVHNVRASYPDLLTQPFEVAQLYQQVVPYRLNRRELGVATVEEYELALMQLLAGTRGYLTGDADMQRALRDELEGLSPDLSAYRAYASSHVAIDADAVRAIDQQAIGHGAAAASARMEAAVSERATQRLGARSTPAASAQAELLPSHQPVSEMPSSSGAPQPASSDRHGGDAAAAAGHTPCRYCGGSLPHGKSIVYCPYCGHDLTVQHCPACNTELEIGWRFCITCGRQVT
jgi:hypothetical protein